MSQPADTVPHPLKTPVALDRVEDLDETRGVRPVDPEHVQRLAIAVDSLPSVDVVKLAGGRFGLLAGYHRREAHRVAGRKTIHVAVWDLPVEAWHPFAVRSNIAHGLPLSLLERKRAARTMLDADPRRSDRSIAADCGLSDKTVAKLRRPDTGDDQGAELPHLGSEVRIGRDGKEYTYVPAPVVPECVTSPVALDDPEDRPADDDRRAVEAIDAGWCQWISQMGTLLMKAERLEAERCRLEEAGVVVELGGYAGMARTLFDRLAERQLDVELRRFFEEEIR